MQLFIPKDAAAVAVGADDVAAALAQGAAAAGQAVEIVRTGSRGMMWLEPLIEVEIDGVRHGFGPIDAPDVDALVKSGIGNAARLRTHPKYLGPVEKIGYLARQTRLTFARCGVIDPLSLDAYRAHGGYRGLERAISLTPAGIVDDVTKSGLRGRGGAGFPTGIKWKTVLDTPAEQKYIVCNADEGDSGTFADRMLMEGDPFLLIEGMTIAGLAVGASKGSIYVRSEYPHAIAALKSAMAIARKAGLLGTDVAGSKRAFDIEVRVGAGAYVCGEETALLESLEGRRGVVRAKPPLPAHKGLFGQPTVINNVLSLCAVPFVLAEGAKAYADYGMGRSRGTMPIQLAANHVFAKQNGKANDAWMPKDESNPYFTYEPSKCIVCSRCVRACEEVQGTFALTIEGRGFESRVSAGMSERFLASECVSCGACVQACPTATLTEKAVIDIGQPEHSVVTTCAYCGVGCSFKAEMRGEEVVRMVPFKDGKANRGHSCVKGRFAWGYATHKERILKPMVRDTITDPWRETTWEEAIGRVASEFKRIQYQYGREAVGGITSSRCTNEETFLVQKLIRAGFGVNNVDTCARVCHSPTGYGLKTTFGTSAGTQDFDSVEDCDVMMVIGANPTDGHPVFASRMKKRLRQGAKLIVVDPRRIDLVHTPHVDATHHLPLQPGTNVAALTAMAHVIVTEGLVNEAFVRDRCEMDAFQEWAAFVAEDRNSPEAVARYTGVDPAELRAAARLYATGGNAAIYYGLGVTEHSQGSTAVMAIANLAMVTGNLGRPGVGVNPLRGQNNVQGSCDMGSFPHELSGYRHVADDTVRASFEALWSTPLGPEPGLRINNMLDAAVEGAFKAIYIQGEDILQSDPNTHHVTAGLAAMECVVVHDLFLNETANYAHVFLPGSTFLEKDGTFTNAERRIQLVRRVMAPRNGYADWEVTQLMANAIGLGWTYTHPSQVMDEIAALTPTFAGVSFAKIEEMGSVQWPCNEANPQGSPVMHAITFARGKGRFMLTEYVPTDERTGPRYPLLLTTGRILSQYNVGAQTRRTHNVVWHDEDRLEMHPHDAEQRGVKDGDWVRLASRAGETALRALVTDRVAPGVVYTTFHHPLTQANLITTDYSDWATNCPEYKVTAVQVSPSNGPTHYQEDYEAFARQSRRIVPAEAAE